MHNTYLLWLFAIAGVQVIYISCVSVGRGLAFGGDTFFSQVIIISIHVPNSREIVNKVLSKPRGPLGDVDVRFSSPHTVEPNHRL